MSFKNHFYPYYYLLCSKIKFQFIQTALRVEIQALVVTVRY